MSRPNPKSPPPVARDEKLGWVTQIRKYKVITPLYGGGEETQKADSITTVRATEVRGHLRFWWRATRGGAFDGDLKKMRDAEEKIWGSSGEKDKPGPSNISVRILNPQNGALKKDQKRGDRTIHIAQPGADWSYVAFPLRESKGSVLEDVFFELEIKYPEKINDEKIKDDIDAALWAWETFGGIGARTRRGFGALQCDDFAKPSTQSARDEIQHGLDKYVLEGAFPKGVPHLNKQLEFRIISSKDSIAAWEYLFKKLKDFRQYRQPPKNNKPGRSLWPEPDAIRNILNKNGLFSFGVHKPAIGAINKFPRAKFGLPINFEFPKREDRDPKKTTLQGMLLPNRKYIDRLASPLIIRPLACSDGAVGLAVILRWEPIESDETYTPPGGLLLTGNDYGDFKVESNLSVADAKTIEPIKNIKGKPQPDILQAFLDYLK